MRRLPLRVSGYGRWPQGRRPSRVGGDESVNPHALGVLEYREVMATVAGRALCALGRDRVLALTPGTDRASIQAELEKVDQVRRFAQRARDWTPPEIPDARPGLKRLALDGSVLDPRELYLLAQLLRAGTGALGGSGGGQRGAPGAGCPPGRAPQGPVTRGGTPGCGGRGRFRPGFRQPGACPDPGPVCAGPSSGLWRPWKDSWGRCPNGWWYPMHRSRFGRDDT